ncbi:phosphotransferase [Syntrophomonas palmitatica]|uniref:phosphotransferase n=1 Tax=Syntrophomonas palmitatica TaxID=402877 RepID=UPI0006D1A8E0|nr:phosphotransferase [Syntrophomonas palmitatica]
MGIFAAIDQLIGVLPADGFNHADFMINNSGEAVMYLASAIGFSGMPTARLDITGGLPVQLKDIQPLAARQLQENGVETTPVWGMLIAADLEPGKGSYFHNQQDIAKGRTLYRDFTGQPGMVCIALAGQTSWNGDANLAPFMAQWGVRAGSDFFKGHAFILSQPLDWVRIEQTKEIWKQCSDLDSLEDVLMVDGDVAITSARIWIWMPELIRTGQEKQLAIELTEEVPFPKEWEVITRRLFSDARRVILDPLVGGFSEGKPFRVTAYDKDNRRMLPTVLKLGPSSLISREIDNHKKYVQNYILNNSTTIMAQSSFGQASGMLYNFLGINGPDSKLGWLTNRYREENIEVLKALFSRIFTSILKPWYGQPVWESMRLYQQHNPLRLFPGLLAAAEQETGVSCDIRTIECPELGTTLPNPYYFLKHEYPKRQNQAQLWYSSINHGDLNMQNILLDERDNVYIIDFAETRSRNIVSDFARLEPIFKFEMTRLADEEDLIRFIEFEQALARTDSLEQVPEWAYKGTDPTVRKAYEMICLIRKYAKTVVIFENDIIPYLLAMLEWTYPIVIYRQITPQGKKAAVYSAALIVEQIMRLEK